MSKPTLLKLLSEAYAFIYFVRMEAKMGVDKTLLRRTEGIDEAIKTMESRFPRGFPKYFDEALYKLCNVYEEKEPAGRKEMPPEEKETKKESR